MDLPRGAGVFPIRAGRKPRSLGLPRVSGGVSLLLLLRGVRQVFPAYAGVFPTSKSIRSPRVGSIARFSSRQWGCFERAVDSVAAKGAFPATAGVFPRESCQAVLLGLVGQSVDNFILALSSRNSAFSKLTSGVLVLVFLLKDRNFLCIKRKKS